MGLDITLKFSKDWEACLASEAAFSAAEDSERVWDMPEAARDARRAELAALHGTDLWGSSTGIVEAEVPASKTNPDHYCNLGYLRSSYNASGFDRVAVERGGLSFYGIFGVTDPDAYHVRVGWSAALGRANGCIQALEARETGPLAGFFPMEIGAGSQILPPVCNDSKQAMEIFAKELARDHASDFRSYSNREGEFYLDGVRVYGFIPGKPQFLRDAVVFAIAKREPDGKPDFYLQAACIAREMIEHVLRQPQPENFRLAWSS